jgi:hypothetical protein
LRFSRAIVRRAAKLKTLCKTVTTAGQLLVEIVEHEVA